MKKILYVPSLNIGVCYWRIENYANQMVREKDRCAVFVDYFFDPRSRVSWDRVCVGNGDTSEVIQGRLVAAFDFYDYIIFQKIQNKEALFIIKDLKRRFPKTKIFVEVDDSIGDITPSNGQEMGDHAKWAAYHCEISDGAICSTKYLADSVSSLNKNTHIAPNCIDTESFVFEPDKAMAEDGLKFRIGYVGAGGHDEDLQLIYKPMLNFLKINERAVFVIRYGGYCPEWLEEHPQIDFKQVSWSIKEYPQHLADLCLDLALAPLRDTEFNRCKSNLKWIEWNYIGVPLLASDVEPYRETLLNGGDIRLVTNVDWENELITQSKLVSNGNWKTDPKQGLEKYNIKAETIKLLDWLETF